MFLRIWLNTLKRIKGEERFLHRREKYEGHGYKGERIDSEIAADFFDTKKKICKCRSFFVITQTANTAVLLRYCFFVMSFIICKT